MHLCQAVAAPASGALKYAAVTELSRPLCPRLTTSATASAVDPTAAAATPPGKEAAAVPRRCF